jgi:DNA-binding winged helix-turn-helix (wHTH) protein/tetratricopeptide (TPR) repeat protein
MSDVKVDLSRESDFLLGDLSVSPSACRVANGNGEERVEPRVMEVLVVLHRSAGHTVTREQLIAACWEGRAVSDDAIARAIMKVRQLTRGADPPPFVVETVPRVGFRFVVPSNARRETAEGADSLAAGAGLASPPQAQASAIIASLVSSLGSTRTVVVLAAILGAAVLSTIVLWAVGPRNEDYRVALGVVAASPFVAVPSTPELTQLARQAGETVARTLATGGVRSVLTNTKVSAAMPPAEFDLTGALDFVGGKYSIHGAIRDRASGLVLWSGATERRIDIAGLDEQFGFQLATTLQCALRTRKGSARPLSFEVSSLLFETCAGIAAMPSGGVELTRRLVAKAPDLAGAQALHALALALDARELDHLSDEAAQLTRQMQAAATRALALDPNAATAHLALGIRIGAASRFAERERYLRRAIKSDPAYTAARIEYSMLLREVGRLGEARETLAKVNAGPWALVNRAFVYAMTGDIGEAHRMLDRLQAFWPDGGLGARWTVAVWWDDPATTLSQLRSLAEGVSPVGTFECFETHLTAIVRNPNRPVRGLSPKCGHHSVDWRIRMLARQGDIDGAYELLERPLPNSRQSYMFLFYPEMKAFRQDPRFMRFVAERGLVRYWRETNQWPDFCAEADLPYDCRRWAGL